MAIYKAPVRDMQFVLHEMYEAEQVFASLPGCEEATRDIIDAILEEAGKLCENVIFPTNRTGDEEGCRFDDGAVTTPSGFKEAYSALTEGGWTSLACDPEYGGQGLPETLHFFVEEMLCSANVAFSLYPGLTHGAYNALHAHGTDELKSRYLPNMVAGRWSGSMCLTEPHSGTDLGLLRTKAEPQDDGSYRITGTKIFITGGEHDLTENIVHLVLARLPDAPPGIKGISLFLVSKFLVNEDGSLGERNGVVCGSIEHKMGIKGSATCVLNFDDAVGHLVGQEHRGMNHMFTMMNHERLAVGLQGLALAEVAYQSAADYAKDRLQGRSPTGAKQADKAADPIIVHPDVRRMLLTAKAYNEGARALSGWVSLNIDIAERHPDPSTREVAEDLVLLLTPVVKAFFTDYGMEACNLCLQVFGGHGYISEWGMEQLVRDARIAQLYEGTNGIQAMDLVGRKLPMHEGRLVNTYVQTIEAFLAETASDKALTEFNEPLAASLGILKDTTDWLAENTAKNPEEVGAAAVEYLRLMALVTLAFMWARAAHVAMKKTNGEEAGFYEAKLATARFYMNRLLPQVTSLVYSIRAGADTLMAMPEASF
ncbi:MAG: acyl-CoA dehydrogenase [Gammaproteobacteria bacterium]|nr:MAG: acyl-CoA dehydrogenase [Gammaproteobacteria bacterium]